VFEFVLKLADRNAARVVTRIQPFVNEKTCDGSIRGTSPHDLANNDRVCDGPDLSAWSTEGHGPRPPRCLLVRKEFECRVLWWARRELLWSYCEAAYPRWRAAICAGFAITFPVPKSCTAVIFHVFRTAHAGLLARALPRLYQRNLSRIVLFTSTSIVTKINSAVESERNGLRRLAEGEQQTEHFARNWA
jgi:hypothetical protein